MNGPNKPRPKLRPRPGDPPDYAAQMARAEFGRHYIDPERVEQTLYYGEILLKPKPPQRRGGS
ncbi:hypothetical protein BH11PSE2_BH11PSE2_18810 [soil metagenome]